MVTLGAIRVWRNFLYIVSYIGLSPIQKYIRKRVKRKGMGRQGVANMVVHNELVYQRIVCDGTLGLAESYMEGWWDCEKVDELFVWFLKSGMYNEMTMPWDRLIHYLEFDVFNLQTAERSWAVAKTHYDLGKMFQTKTNFNVTNFAH